jgi:hypothetical protein
MQYDDDSKKNIYIMNQSTMLNAEKEKNFALLSDDTKKRPNQVVDLCQQLGWT